MPAIFRFVFAPFVIAALPGCAGPRMVPPADLANGQVLEVQDRSRASGLMANESFRLGAFQVSDVDRESVGTTSLSIGSFGASDTKTGYKFRLTGGESAWDGVCAFERQGESMSFSVGTFGKLGFSLACECVSGERKAGLELKNNGDQLEGSLSAGGPASYRVTQVRDTDKKTLGGGPAGYRFDTEDGARGAVEVLHPGRVWLGGKLAVEEKEPVACLMAGLMLYREPEEE